MIKDQAILYDANFNAVSLPHDTILESGEKKFGYSVHALGVNLSSIDEVNTFETVPGVPGQSLIHNNKGTRDVSLDLFIRARDDYDYNLKLNRLYTFLRRLGVFFIASAQEPNKLLKVKVEGRYTPTRSFTERRDISEVNVPLSIVGQPYRISRYTSMDIHNNDIQFDGKWSAGMHLPAVDETVNGITMDYQYVFENQTDIQVFNPSDIDMYVKQHLDCKIEFECLQSMSEIRLLDGLSKEFVFTDDLVAGDVVTIEGHRIKKNGQLDAGKFNDVYPTLLSNFDEVYQQYSVNEMQVSAGVKVKFDFRYKYD
ncbi:phage tail domain-containing protein [Salinicoccus roseus]|uniref:phage tail domain-containing protein n=1 Tax=Salinicoccus roseus TaxID=45670 RepID=UPI002300FF1C|nr:phage tail domain-containing protein [Salinicoccus roseus]